jgi:hypothetical protein
MRRGSHGSEDNDVLGIDAMQICRWIPTFQRNILPLSSALKMETVCLSEMLVLTLFLSILHNASLLHYKLATFFDPSDIRSDINTPPSAAWSGLMI